MSEKFPRLSKTLKPFRALNICQSCDREREKCSLWQEHDDNDRKQAIVINLCEPCGKLIIKPHPRLYSMLWPNTPFPGAMQICTDCKFRDGTRCTSPYAKSNGGPGVMLSVVKPQRAMIDGTGFRGMVEIYSAPASACRQKKTDWDAPSGNATESAHPWEAARDHFFKNVIPLLEKHGPEIGAAHNAGNKTATEIINRYTMLRRSYDPMTAVVIEQKIEEFLNDKARR